GRVRGRPRDEPWRRRGPAPEVLRLPDPAAGGGPHVRGPPRDPGLPRDSPAGARTRAWGRARREGVAEDPGPGEPRPGQVRPQVPSGDRGRAVALGGPRA